MLMTTYSLPLSDSNGKFYAVLTADISLDWLTDMIHRKDSISNAEQLVDTAEEPIYSFIIGREGKYIVHPDKELILGETFLSHCLKTKSTEDDRMAYDMLAGKKDYILAVDQSTQGTKGLVFDRLGRLVARADRPHRQIIDENGYVEHDPMEILHNTLEVCADVIRKACAS